jgi:hypothetical protein
VRRGTWREGLDARMWRRVLAVRTSRQCSRGTGLGRGAYRRPRGSFVWSSHDAVASVRYSLIGLGPRHGVAQLPSCSLAMCTYPPAGCHDV